jgi:signal transduction histidine kinase
MYVDRIRVSVRRMSALITDLLSYSRLNTRAQPFRRVDLGRIVEEVKGDLQVLLEETQGRVERGSLPAVRADPTQMRQLFQNLIGNAIKFHRPGVPPLVRVRAGQPPLIEAPEGGEHYTIVVEDNGIGFDEKYAGRLFDPFYRLHTRSKYEGTGLGLAICKRIVERHEGTITARSRPGGGATFAVSLPVRGRAVPAGP